MVVAILIAGIWGIWKALVQRRYTETAGALAVSVVFVLIALFFVYQPERTIGQASRWTNTLSLAFLSGRQPRHARRPRTRPSARSPTTSSRRSSTSRGWSSSSAGCSHCVDTDRLDGDGFPRPVSPHDPARDVCRDHLQPGRATGTAATRRGSCASPPGSDERNAEYDALRKGSAPSDRRAVRRLPGRQGRLARPSTSSRSTAPSSA